MADNSARDRIRQLVREVLDKAIPEGEHRLAPDPGPSTSSKFIDVTPKSPINTATEATATRDESSKTVITEDDVRGLENGAVLRIAENARFTPLAADLVQEKQIEIVRKVPRRGSKTPRMVAVGADHGGFRMKEELKRFLEELGYQVHDFGTTSEDAVDYPDFAYVVAKSVSDKTADVGIVIDGAGVGSAMTANKVPGVRAAAAYSVEVARNSREHNDANVLTLGSKTINSKEMREIVRSWLGTELTEDRHRKRVRKIEAIEKQYLR